LQVRQPLPDFRFEIEVEPAVFIPARLRWRWLLHDLLLMRQVL